MIGGLSEETYGFAKICLAVANVGAEGEVIVVHDDEYSVSQKSVEGMERVIRYR